MNFAPRLVRRVTSALAVTLLSVSPFFGPSGAQAASPMPGSGDPPDISSPYITPLFVNLGAVPIPPTAGNIGTVPSAMSNDGHAVCGESGGHAFLWTPLGGMSEIQMTGSGFRDYDSAIATDLSADGSVVTGYVDLGFSYETMAWRLSADFGLEALPNSLTYGLSGDGNRTVGSQWYQISTSTWKQRAIRWTGSTVNSLSHAGPGAALAVSADGLSIVGSFEGSASLWRILPSGYPDRLTLAVPPGLGGNGQARSISDNGWFAVGNVGYTPVRWTIRGNQVQVLPAPPNGTALIDTARAISPDGSIIVGRAVHDFGGKVSAAYIWDAVNGPRWLRGVLESYGLVYSMSGWKLEAAVAVSSDANYIYFTGYGTTYDPTVQAWWARVPKPLQ